MRCKSHISRRPTSAHLGPDRLREAVAALEGLSTRSAHNAKLDDVRRVNPDAPVAQVDRAAVS
jgi:hypothetical protein